jgi:hypothetical protein
MDFHRYTCNLLSVYFSSLGNFLLNPFIPSGEFHNLFYLSDFSEKYNPHNTHTINISIDENTGISFGIHVEIFRDNRFYYSVDYNATIPSWEVNLI